MSRPIFRRGSRERPQPFGKAERNESSQMQGRRKEVALARDLGGNLQPGSGCFDGRGGDVRAGRFLIDSKYTKALSFTVTIQALRKLKQEAYESVRKPTPVPALVIEMSGGMMYEMEKWALIPYEEFRRLQEGNGV
jgi:hypothetical protein